MYSFNCWDFCGDVDEVIMHGNVTSIVHDKAAVGYLLLKLLLKIK